MAKLDGTTGRWVVSETVDLTEGLGPRRGVAAGLVHPGRVPLPSLAGAGAESHRRAVDRPVSLRRDGAATTGGAAATDATSSGSRPGRRPPARSCASGSIRTRRPCPTGSAATCAASRRSPGSLLEAAGPFAAAVKPNLAFFEAFGSAGLAALERIRAAVPAGPAGRDRRQARRHRLDRRAPGRRPCTTGSARTRSRSARISARRRSRRSSRAPDRFAYVLCRTSNPGRRRAPGPDVAADPALGAPGRAALGAGRPAASQTWGPGGTVGLVVGATAPAELAAIRALAPGLAFLVPGVGAQGGDAAAVLADGRATAAPAGRAAGRRPPRQRLARDRRRGRRRTRRGGRRRPRRARSRRPPATGRARLPVLP